jgi:predicted CDP-diglyceride synthetase/phosphatidate cytidylyltransferase
MMITFQILLYVNKKYFLNREKRKLILIFTNDVQDYIYGKILKKNKI